EEALKHELGIDEQCLLLDGPSQDVARGVEDRSAPGELDLVHVRLTLQTADGLLASVGLEIRHPAYQCQQGGCDAPQDEGGASGRERDRVGRGHRPIKSAKSLVYPHKMPA